MHGVAPEWGAGRWPAARFWAQPSPSIGWTGEDMFHCYRIILN